MVVLNTDAYGFIFEDRDVHTQRFIAFNDESEEVPMNARLIESLILMHMRQLRTRIISAIAGEVNNEQVHRSFHRRVYRNHANYDINNTLDSIRTSMDLLMNDHLNVTANDQLLAHTITSDTEPNTESDTEPDTEAETSNTHTYHSHDDFIFIAPSLAQRLDLSFDSSNAFTLIHALDSSDSFTSFNSSDSFNDSAPTNAFDGFDFTNDFISSDTSDSSTSSDSSDSLSSEDITIDYNSILNTT